MSDSAVLSGSRGGAGEGPGVGSTPGRPFPAYAPRAITALFVAYDQHAAQCRDCGRGNHRLCPEGTAIREKWLRALECSQ
jgi:hypothetical protein